MAIQQKTWTVEEFDRYIALPENADRLFELIHGEIIPVSPGRTLYSEIGHILAVAVRLFCRERNIPCHTSGGDGAYRVEENTVAPDFAYKPTPMSDEYPDPAAPLWAVEVISPTDKANDIREKREIYQKAGILLWEIYPKLHRIDVYAAGQPVKTLGMDSVLDGGDVLPEFRLTVREIFA